MPRLTDTGPTSEPWFADLLDNRRGSVGSVVPSTVEACARILHPASMVIDDDTSWRTVCSQTHRVAHGSMQFGSISVSPAEHGRWAWPGQAPNVGALSRYELELLVSFLDGRTRGTTTFLLWQGFAWVQMMLPALGLTRRSAPARFIDDQPFLEFQGTLAEVIEGASWVSDVVMADHPPSFFWPEDRNWFVATGIDFDSTILGGDRELVDDVVRVPGLEAWRGRRQDSLMLDADVVNTD